MQLTIKKTQLEEANFIIINYLYNHNCNNEQK